ncbi:MAG TPA: response regulator [Thermoanaerobaculia bacterium]|nr:response regulator [Thermoanaerobaculia bacterium]
MNGAEVPSKTGKLRKLAGTILVVEDDPDSREVFAELLRAEGHPVVAVRSGAEALEYLRRADPPSVILLDMLMPDMDGWQFRKAQQADPDLAGIPVVVVSALRTVANSAMRFGAVAFLPKPIAPADLIGTISRAEKRG